jgi:DNA-binding Lrp family transcriptional regulator
VFEQVDVSNILKSRKITIAAIQLESPFWKEVSRSILKGNNILSPNTDHYQKRKIRIKNILNNLMELERSIDVVVFPEYSFFDGFLEDKELEIEKISTKMNSIIIGNYYDQQERKSVTFIVLPKEINGKRIYKFYKFTPSKYDQDYLVKNEKFEIPRLFWKTEDGETVGMVVFTCIDFLSCDVSQLSYNNNIIIVIMHSKELSDFTERIKAMIRRSLENNKGCVGVFVNAFGGDLAAAGRTGFYGIGQSREDVENWRIRELKDSLIIGDIIPTAVYKISTINIPNKVLSNIVVYNIDDAGQLVNRREIASPWAGYAINPNVFKFININRAYGYFQIEEDYISARQKISKMSKLDTYALFGTYDILAHSYENSGGEHSFEYLKLRLPKDLKYRNFNGLLVSGVLKFRGKIIKDIPNEFNIRAEDKDILELIGKFLRRNIKEEEFEKLKQRNILIQVEEGLEFSDVSEKEREKGYREYLVFLKVYGSNDRARRSLLDYILDLKEIRTVEQIDNREGPDSDYDYVLHVVAKDLGSLANLLYRLHEFALNNGLRIDTTTNIFVEEKISHGSYDVFFETRVTDYATRDTLIKILSDLKEITQYPFDPFIIKRLDKEDIENIVNFYINATKYIDKYMRDHELPIDPKIYISEFICGIAEALEHVYKGKPDDASSLILAYCEKFAHDVITKFEAKINELIDKWFDEKLSKLDENIVKEVFEYINNKKKLKLKLSKDEIKKYLSTKIRVIMAFDSYYYMPIDKLKDNKEKKIVQIIKEYNLNITSKKEEYDSIKKCQKYMIEQFRNWLSHAGTDVSENKKVPNDLGSIREFVKAIIACLEYLLY